MIDSTSLRSLDGAQLAAIHGGKHLPMPATPAMPAMPAMPAIDALTRPIRPMPPFPRPGFPRFPVHPRPGKRCHASFDR